MNMELSTDLASILSKVSAENPTTLTKNWLIEKKRTELKAIAVYLLKAYSKFS
jgi:hypothetical protein